jgi:excisionase family DNA binding protein
MENTELLTLPEVAAQLRVHIVQVRRLVNRGQLQAVRVSPRNVRVQRAHLEAMLAEQAVAKAAA